MNYLISSENFIYIVSDITAGIFLTVLVISTIAHQILSRPGLTHLFASIMLILAGIFERFFALVMGIPHGGIEWRPMHSMPLPHSADVAGIMAFILISIGICEAVVHAVYVNEGADRSVFRPVLIMSGIIGAAGITAFVITGSINSLTLATLIQLLCLNVFLYVSKRERAGFKFRRASAVAIVTFLMMLGFVSVNLTGLGLSLMLIILNEQFHEQIGRELAENEAALAKSRLQLLTEQISPHYIYNSLQSIRDLCETDPAMARDAIDAFSEYLRGNLESLTKEDMIPFSRELEHTRSYLELEKIAGRRRFEVEYDLDTTDFMLPPLVLEPLVENAVIHGGGGGSQRVIITITTRETEGTVCIEVTDRPEGKADAGKTESAIACETDVVVIAETDEDVLKRAKTGRKGENVGLGNVRTRLAIQCGGTLDISSCGDGTKATITLPGPPKTASH